MITLVSNNLTVKIRPQSAELSSIMSNDRQTEYLWQGDPAFWSGQAPILFPIVGALKDKKYTHAGRTYSLPQHGFARSCHAFNVVEHTTDKVGLRLVSDHETREVYPFEFELVITFSVKGNAICITHEVKNTGPDTMFFSLGGHPAFRCPLMAHEKWEEYQITFEQTETDVTWQISPDGLIGKNTRPVLNNQNVLPLSDNIFDNGALIFKNLKSRKAWLSHKKQGEIIGVEFTDFPYLGLWSKPGAPFVCIEPWHGIADSVDADGQLSHKEGIIALPAGEDVTKRYSITVSCENHGELTEGNRTT